MRELALVAPPWPLRICGHSNRLSAAPLELVDYCAALEAIDEEIYILRLRSVLGPAKALPLSLRGLTLCRKES